MIRSLLIANRGEIACRIIRTAQRMGIATVAVHSDADAGAPHVRMADRAVRIGPAEAARSYLDQNAILAAARLAGADAVHPGYGFLSENADFADACASAGLVFVGPPASAIRAMGDKAKARILVAAAGVPVVPGYDGEDQSAERMAAEAKRIGFPLLVKASAGGGGRGMRRVRTADDLAEAIASARREAENAFGSGDLILERLVEEARHIEVQVFADGHGHVIHLGARDCSAQRRHQKIVEESPPPIAAGVLDAMARDAIACAKAVAYVGAGTVEFIAGADGGYHFLEMNTRLQVEHPVTEMVTGLDLVEWQLRVAQGEPLPLRQEEVVFAGHAIEARLYAEDPQSGFRPQTGTVRGWRPEVSPDEPGLRIDTGVEEGQAVTPFYDPMIAKLIAHGRDRDEAIGRLVLALRRRPLFGLKTNRGFLVDLLASPEFRAGAVTTDLIDRWIAADAALLRAAPPERETVALAAAWLALSAPGGWFRSTGIAACPITLDCDGTRFETVVRFDRGRLAGVFVDGEAAALAEARIEGARLYAVLGEDAAGGGSLAVATVFAEGRDVWLDRDGRTWRFSEPDRLASRLPEADPSVIRTPVTGALRALSVSAGDRVEAGQTVGMVEAMKMETVLASSGSGTVSAVRAGCGEQVRAGDVIVELELDG
ncbi:biotin carboxylase N-terminal domain-containing protein [Aquibium sp. ELW1220]|uniref:acetyl/propionyl/methylcrotonyl-CoA carboxylase subunit alpha n=1 Tax=Aquibium sp. ELW1220 TaxID=2976766 RepID=UPI0025AED687|nr:biotin carboxylase N-terminal domain-containing protein [Aquibium sp. ELW1220]MDN2580569.1 ATP-grasp domain-containing protein [Aquibium sp. ELW1220]